MKGIVFAAALVACVPFVPVLAHTGSVSTHPADGATLDAEPDMLRVMFQGPARVVKVIMTHTGPEGIRETRLEPLSKEPTEALHLEPEFTGSGDYEIAWRALGEDGHVVTGTFSFRVR